MYEYCMNNNFSSNAKHRHIHDNFIIQIFSQLIRNDPDKSEITNFIIIIFFSPLSLFLLALSP